MDGISGKWPGLGTFDQNDQVIQTVQDALEEVKVVSSGMPAEFGHAASGGMQLTYRSGTNQLHFSFEDRLIRSSYIQRSYFQQTPQNPFTYDAIEGTFSGPAVFPQTVRRQEQDFFLWWPLLTQRGHLPTNPGRRADPRDAEWRRLVRRAGVSDLRPQEYPPGRRYLDLRRDGWQPRAQEPVRSRDSQVSLQHPLGIAHRRAGTPDRDRADPKLSRYAAKSAIQRTRWDVKVDHQLSFAHKMFGRYSQAHHRAQAYPSVAITWELLDRGASSSRPT